MNAYANHVVSYLFAQSWQIAVLAGMVGLISLALRSRSAHLRYLLWLIVLAKCLVPPVLTIPLAVLPEQSSSPSVAGVALAEEYSAPELPVSVGGATQPPQLKPAVPSVRELIALVWGAGAFLFLLWVGGRTVRYTSWLRERRRPLPPALQKSIQELSMGFKFRKWPRIWLLEDIGQPFVWGLLRGSVYLPADFVDLSGRSTGILPVSPTGVSPVKDHAGQGQDGPATHGQDAHATTTRLLRHPLSGSDRQRSILAHELSHVARFDAGVNLLQVLAQAVYWFHPFVWWSNRKIRQEREKCCDEMAVAHLNTPPEHYTGAIVDVLAAERRSVHPIPSLAIVGSVKDIEERIKTMLRPGKTFRTHPSLVAMAVALLIALVTIPTALVLTARGQTQPPAQSADERPANKERPQQPRFGARTFNSKLAFDVFVREETPWRGWRSGEMWIGRTPSTTPLQVPACQMWGVRIKGPVEDWNLLVREVKQNSVPELSWSPPNDSALTQLADLRSVEQLDLFGAWPTEAGLPHLKSLPHLQGLHLRSAWITDEGLTHLKDLTELQELYLACKITDASLEHIVSLTGLRRLYLDYCPITDAGLARLKGLTGLQELQLLRTQITDAGLEYFKDLTELRFLRLEGTEFTGAGFVHLTGLAKMQGLMLGGTKITDAELSRVNDLPGLQGLMLWNANITDGGLGHLRGLTGLRQLHLASTRITAPGLVHLKDLRGLQWLSLGDFQMTDASLEHLKDLTRLRALRLADCPITDSGLRHLSGLTGLTGLNLSGTRITDAGLEHLKGLTGLQQLNLSGTQVTDAGVQQLKQSLPKLTIERNQAK